MTAPVQASLPAGGRPWQVALDAATATIDVEPVDLPVALWGLHQVLRVGASADLHVARCNREMLGRLVDGAGFTATSWSATATPDVRAALSDGVSVRVDRQRSLADTVGSGMRLMIVGLNPSIYAADVGVGFARPGNRAWPALLAAGLATTDRDPLDLLCTHRIGMTDLVKRATAKASELSPEEFRHGLDRLDSLCAWLRPGAICVLGVTGWRSAVGDRTAGLGLQDRTLGGRPVYVMPNPSGLNAHTNVDDLVHHLHAAAAISDR